jgi:hypothetical protein
VHPASEALASTPGVCVRYFTDQYYDLPGFAQVVQARIKDLNRL